MKFVKRTVTLFLLAIGLAGCQAESPKVLADGEIAADDYPYPSGYTAVAFDGALPDVLD